MKCLVTGGAGFIGSHLVDRLLEDGNEVVVLDDFSTGRHENLNDAKKRHGLTVILGDITDAQQLEEKLPKGIDVVFHTAAIVSVQLSISKPELVRKVNFEGTVNLLRFSTGNGVNKFVLSSSAAVYGDPKRLPLTEDETPNPISPYGWSKLEAEAECMKAMRSSGLKTVILRYFNVYGPRSPRQSDYAGVISKFAERLMQSKSPVIYGDGNQTRDFIFVEDVVQANILALSSTNANGKTFNVATGIATTIEELAKLESKIVCGENFSSHCFPVHELSKVGDIRNSYANISVIEKELGFRPRYSLERGLQEYFDWLKNN